MKGNLKLSHRYSPSSVLHIYQRAIDQGVIFYTLEDRLVYYSVAASKAKKHNVKISAAAIMYTHTHQSVQAESINVVLDYLHSVDTSFAKMYNNHYHRKGRLFEKYPGISQKTTSKAIRSNLVYVFNNHVEKGLSRRAVDERWSFLPYVLSNHPFSEALFENRIGKVLQKAINLVDRRVNKLHNLTYFDLKRILPYLDTREKKQFVDYLIWRYAWVDFSLAVSQFGSKEALIVATDSTSGGEYDLREEYSRESDVGYRRLIEYTDACGFLPKVHSSSTSERTDTAVTAAKRAGVSIHQLKKFFHI